MNAVLAGGWSELEGTLSELIALVDALDEEAINWRPPAQGSNSIAALVRHTMGAASMWCSIALDEPFERDRDAEFRVHESPESLVAALRELTSSLGGQFERLDAVDPASEHRDPRRGSGGDLHTAGWCIAHVLSHTGEHWGQIQLTRDLYRAQA